MDPTEVDIPIRVLLVARQQDDFLLLSRMLSEVRETQIVLEWVPTLDEGLASVKLRRYDMCLVGDLLYLSSAPELIKKLRGSGFASPIIFITEQGSEEVDLQFLKESAVDYVDKKQLGSQFLERTILYAVERSKYQEALSASEWRLKRLSRELMQAQENERKRLARDLHDSIGSSLSAIRFALEREFLRMTDQDTSRDRASFEKILSSVDFTIKDLRRIYLDLRPPLLDDLGLLAAIGSLVRRFQGTFPDVHVGKILDVAEEDIPDPLKVVIYRVLQESLNNTSKHSSASRLEISLAKKGNVLVLSVFDDGKGFELSGDLSPDETGLKLGLGGIRDRVEMSGGVLTILSGSGKGTEIRSTWTLP